MLFRPSGSFHWVQVLLGLLLLGIVHCACRFPKENITNGQYVYQSRRDSRRIRAPDLYVLKFKCHRGYSRIGPKYIQCVDREWSDQVPSCERMECFDPPVVENANVTIRGGTSHVIGTTLTYSCKEGYTLNDSSVTNLVCDLDKKTGLAVWKGEIPSCRAKLNCTDPGKSQNGEKKGNCCVEDNVLRFSCHDDYELTGSEKITCLSNGRWSSARPLCRPNNAVHCESPPEIPHGKVTGLNDGDYFLPGEVAEVLCEPGYKYKIPPDSANCEKDGDFHIPYDDPEAPCEPGYDYTEPSEYIKCEEGGEWKGKFGECVEITCGRPEPPSNGTIHELLTTNLTVFPYNFEITYGCGAGYRLLGGDSWRFCGEDGWSGNEPHCKEMRCPDPRAPEHGEQEGDSLQIGAKVRFRCHTGYILLGSIERYCMPNGQWTGELARCDASSNYCPNPGTPINGYKTGSSYDVGDKVRFHCRKGYILLGSEVRECLYNRTWTGSEAKCLHSYDFDNSAQLSEILKTKMAEEWGLQARVRILDLNYQGRLVLHFAFDVSGSVGEHNFERSIDFAKAIVKKVGISEGGARAGALTFNSKAENSFLPMNLKTTEDVLHELDQIKLRVPVGGGTSATSALSLIRENIGLEEEDEWFGKKDKKDVVFILTDGKVNMDGSPEIEARDLRQAGVEIFCIGITGDPKIETLYKIASKSKYGNEVRKNVFVLQNYTQLSYLVQEITNGTIDYSQCGLGMDHVVTEHRGKIVDGERSVESWPWMAALFFKPRSAKSMDEAELKCGGSIINRKFILTAAHCMYFRNKRMLYMRKKGEIMVKLGLTDVTNESMAEDFAVNRIIMHKRYRPGNYIAQKYDFDIALLELDRPIDFHRYIRPICLPPKELPKESRLYGADEFAWATGWGHTSVVNPNHLNVRYTMSKHLKQIRLPIQPNNKCRLSLRQNKYDEKKFTKNMFCAGDGQFGNDTCVGDSGSPLMQAQMNSDGFVYWTQVGIVSWGHGCGWINNYGYYTHVHYFIDWIHEKINEQNDDVDE